MATGVRFVFPSGETFYPRQHLIDGIFSFVPIAFEIEVKGSESEVNLVITLDPSTLERVS